MSIALIRDAFEAALAAVTPVIVTVWENMDASPQAGTAYQAAYLMPAEPENPEIGPGYIQRGIFQVNQYFPQGKGWQNPTAQAEAVRTAFPRGRTLINGSIKINIIATPEIGPGRAEDDLYFTPVKVRWSAQFFGG